MNAAGPEMTGETKTTHINLNFLTAADIPPEAKLQQIKDLFVNYGLSSHLTPCDQRNILNSLLQNVYGAWFHPVAGLFNFANTTASTINEQQFAAAGKLFGQFKNFLELPDTTYQGFIEHVDLTIRNQLDELIRLLGFTEGQINGTGINDGVNAFSATNGTDTEFFGLLACLQKPEITTKVLSVMFADTGSETANHGAGNYGNTLTWTGEDLTEKKNLPIPGFPQIEPMVLPVKTLEHGVIDIDLQAQQDLWRNSITRFLDDHADSKLLLRVVPGTKGGNIGGNIEMFEDLQKKYGERIQILIDVAQLRVPFADIQEWVAKGHLVAVSLSKMAEGAPFSAVVLANNATTAKIRLGLEANGNKAPEGLGAYLDQSCFPLHLRHQVSNLPYLPNWPLALRMETGLHTLRRIANFSQDQIEKVMSSIVTCITDEMSESKYLQQIPARIPSIQSFTLKSEIPGISTPEALEVVWKLLPLILELPPGVSSGRGIQDLVATRAALGQPFGKHKDALRFGIGFNLVADMAEYAYRDQNHPADYLYDQELTEAGTIFKAEIFVSVLAKIEFILENIGFYRNWYNQHKEDFKPRE